LTGPRGKDDEDHTIKTLGDEDTFSAWVGTKVTCAQDFIEGPRNAGRHHLGSYAWSENDA